LTQRESSCQLPKEREMVRCRPVACVCEPAMYRICILGTLDKKWSDYYGGMTIENVSDPERIAMTWLTGRLADQSALMGVLNSLYDIGCPILMVECVEGIGAG
jgi:hypothetical protein